MRIPEPRLRAQIAGSLAGTVAALCGAPLAAAHSYSVAYADLEVSADRRDVSVTVRINAGDLYEVLELPEDRPARPGEIHAGRDKLYELASSRLTVRSRGKRCPATRLEVRPWQQSEWFAEIRWTTTCAQPIALLQLDYQLFFDVDRNHTGMVVVHHGNERTSMPMTRDAHQLTWELARPPPSGLGAYVRHGVHHILIGYDHIAFLLSLLLVAVVVRTDQYHLRSLRHGLRYTAGIVTAFTVAHSLTLVAAAVGWLQVPGRLVESSIALSIIAVCAENLLDREPRRRWVLASVFGLVHGLGFASVLRAQLPANDALAPLLSFNVGVELGQLAIAAAVFPLLHLAARRYGAPHYRRWVVVPGSVLLGMLGTTWLVERLAGIELLARLL